MTKTKTNPTTAATPGAHCFIPDPPSLDSRRLLLLTDIPFLDFPRPFVFPRSRVPALPRCHQLRLCCMPPGVQTRQGDRQTSCRVKPSAEHSRGGVHAGRIGTVRGKIRVQTRDSQELVRVTRTHN